MLFRFNDVLQVVRNKSCNRELPQSSDLLACERDYAVRYPHRAVMFANAYTMQRDGPDSVTKKLLMELLYETAYVADFSGARSLYERIAIKGEEDDYVESVQALPLRAMLRTCGLPFTENELSELQRAGMDYVKAFDNVDDESLLKAADEGEARVCDYLDARLREAEPDTRVHQLIRKGTEHGVGEERMKMKIAGSLIISLANTAGISSAYVLRTLERKPEVRREFCRNPGRIQDDNVMTELLRRDKHVKGPSRFFHVDVQLGRFTLPKSECIYLFFSGVNMDPALYAEPLGVDLARRCYCSLRWRSSELGSTMGRSPSFWRVLCDPVRWFRSLSQTGVLRRQSKRSSSSSLTTTPREPGRFSTAMDERSSLAASAFRPGTAGTIAR